MRSLLALSQIQNEENARVFRNSSSVQSDIACKIKVKLSHTSFCPDLIFDRCLSLLHKLVVLTLMLHAFGLNYFPCFISFGFQPFSIFFLFHRFILYPFSHFDFFFDSCVLLLLLKLTQYVKRIFIHETHSYVYKQFFIS